jgi:serine phosphatase RsbU (regulator of sigma subunit)
MINTKIISAILILIILTPVLLLSDPLVDSLEKRLAKVSGNDKIDLLNQLSKAYRQSYPDSCVYYGNIATTLAKKSNYRKGEVEAELYIAAGESYNTSPKKSMEKLNNILKESQEINFKEGIAFALRFIGILKAEMSDYKGSNQEYEKAIEIGKEINYVEGNANCYNNLGENYTVLTKSDLAIQNFQKGFELFDNIGYYNQATNCLIAIGNIYKNNNNFEKAVQYYFNAYNYSKGKADNPDNTYALQSLAMVYLSWNNYDKVEEFGNQALESLSKSRDKFVYGQFLNAMGTFYIYMMKNPDKALELHEKSLAVFKQMNYTIYIYDEYFEIGNSFKLKGDYTKALDSYQKALDVSHSLERNYITAKTLNALGELYFEMKDYSKSIEYNTNALNIVEADSSKWILLPILYDLGNTYFCLKDYKQSEDFLMRASDINKSLNSRDMQIKIYKTLSDLYKEQGKFEPAFKFMSLYSALSDSISNDNNTKKLANMQMKYELDGKENEILLLNKKKEIQLTILISCLAIILFFSIFAFSRFIIKKRTAKQLEEKNQELETINNFLVQSENILKVTNQEKDRFLSIIKSELSQAASYVQSLLPCQIKTGDVKVQWCYIPSAQLGGDFFGYYWMNADTFVIYLLDVSGHGIGPSLHSISVFNALRFQSLPNTDYKDPANVLNSLNRSFQMKQNKNLFFTIWYGVYDRNSRELKYATGGHPPAIMLSTNGNRDRDGAIRLNTRNYAIGGASEFEYRSDSVIIKNPSEIYIFSDGVYEIRQYENISWDIDELEKYLKNFHSKEDNILENLYDHVKKINGNETLEDDFSILKISIEE